MTGGDRGEAVAAFVARHGWGCARRAPLAGDASFRRYERLTDPSGATALVMDAPPPHEDTRPFAALAAYLTGEGFSAPTIYATDHARGFLLIEDLGTATFTGLLANEPARETALYTAAVDTLASLHRRPAPASLPIPDAGTMAVEGYDGAVLTREACLMTDWYLPEMGLGGPEAGAALTAMLAPLVPAMQLQPPVLVLRDYHVDNLMHLPDRPGVRSVGLLDFQDALAGHPAYDLVSLLQDVRRAIPADLEEHLLARYLAATGADPDSFRRAYRLLGVQRNLKIAGIFARLWRRDGKPRYLSMIPRAWTLIARNLAEPEAAALKAWIDRVVPPDRRLTPPQPEE